LIELTFASVFWGFGFIGTIWALRFLSFPAVIFYRFIGAFLAGALLWLWTRPKWSELKHELELSRGAGFWLAVTLILQTWGLLSTTATKSAFITVLYVVFVPLLAAIFDREKLSLRNTFCLTLALVGTGMIVNLEFSGLSNGDLLTLGNALAAAFHIRVMGQLAPRSKNHYNFNLFQCFWTALFTLPLLGLELVNEHLFKGNWNLEAMDGKGWIGILSLTFGSSLLAFFLQVRAQKKLSATVAAILFLMESPFSAFFAVWLLGDVLSPVQVIGAAIIFISCLAASLPKKMAPGAHP
jgi:drug/metabolite transporter (DMT)-like permease